MINLNSKIFTISFVRGMSVVLPKKIVEVKNLGFDNSDDLINMTGIHCIRQSTDDKAVSDYCTSAAEHLLEELNFDKSQIDGIVFATPHPDYLTVGSGYIIQKNLGLSEKCMIVDLYQACAGFVYGLWQASLMIESGYCRNILLCFGDTPTKHIHPKDRSLRSIMSDAGGCAIISAGGDYKSTYSFFNDGNKFEALYTPAGASKILLKRGITDIEKIDEHGNIHTLENPHMDGLEVMVFAMDAVPDTVSEVLKAMQWSKDDVNMFVLHQANETMIRTLGKRLRLPAEKVPIQLNQYGNTACASIPLTLCLENVKKSSSWDKVILCGFGNGLACAAAALNLSKTYFSEIHEL